MCFGNFQILLSQISFFCSCDKISNFQIWFLCALHFKLFSNWISAEKKTSMGVDWHATCLKCEKCKKTVQPGQHAVHDNKPYCHKPCYASTFGPTRKCYLFIKKKTFSLNVRFLFSLFQLSHERFALHMEIEKSIANWWNNESLFFLVLHQKLFFFCVRNCVC